MSGEQKPTRREQVRADLIRRFQDCAVGARLPSDRVLAKELGVAYLTVNRVMRELAWEGYVRRMPRKGTFLASREKAIRNDLHTGTLPGEHVIFAYPNYFSFAIWTRLRAAEEQALKRGLGLLEFKMSRDTTYESFCEFVGATENVRGVFLMPLPDSIDRSTLSLLDDLDVPMTILAACEIASLGRRIWSVTTDWYKAGYLRAECLVRSGHQDIAYVHNEPDAPEWRRMLRGMRRAVSDGKLLRRNLTVLGRGARPWQDTRKSGYELTAQALDAASPTGIVYDSFGGAQGGLRAVWEKGLSVPAELSIVAGGGSGGDEDFTMPQLTTVDECPDEEVRTAFECVLGGPSVNCRTLTVPPVINSRHSVAGPSAPSKPRQGGADASTAKKGGKSGRRSSVAV